VSQPVLYERYSRQEAVALFGSGQEAESHCDGQWLVFPDALVLLAAVGEPQMSRFEAASRFCWAAEKPYRVGRHGDATFVPAEAVAPHSDRPIHLFVRSLEQPTYLYAGRLSPSHCQRLTYGTAANFGEAYFCLAPALPSATLAELGEYDPGDTDPTELDRSLESLATAPTAAERLAVLDRVVAYWHRPIAPGDGYDEGGLAGLRLPGPLRWWFRRAGRRAEVMSGQNRLLKPDEMQMRDGLLVFYGENQWCYEWATRVEGDDPPVFGREGESDPWRPEGVRLSEHLILAALFEAVMCHSRYGASASWLPQAELDEIVRHVPALTVGPWRWGGEFRFYARGGAFLFTAPNGEVDGSLGYSVWIGAKTGHPLAFLKPLVDESWEYVSL
jgi:hypothetical protein